MSNKTAAKLSSKQQVDLLTRDVPAVNAAAPIAIEHDASIAANYASEAFMALATDTIETLTTKRDVAKLQKNWDAFASLTEAIEQRLRDQAVADNKTASRAFFCTFETDESKLYINVPATIVVQRTKDGRWTTPSVSMSGAFKKPVTPKFTPDQRKAFDVYLCSMLDIAKLTGNVCSALAKNPDNSYSAAEAAEARKNKKKKEASGEVLPDNDQGLPVVAATNTLSDD